VRQVMINDVFARGGGLAPTPPRLQHRDRDQEKKRRVKSEMQTKPCVSAASDSLGFLPHTAATASSTGTGSIVSTESAWSGACCIFFIKNV